MRRLVRSVRRRAITVGYQSKTINTVTAETLLRAKGCFEKRLDEAAHELIYRPLRNPDGPPQPQVEYKLRRFVNDYVAPPKVTTKMNIALEHFDRMHGEIAALDARSPHELMRCVEVSFSRDCAELATRASLTRTESRCGLYHQRADLPGRDDANWFCHLNVYRGPDGTPTFVKRPVEPYVVPVDGLSPDAFQSAERQLA